MTDTVNRIVTSSCIGPRDDPDGSSAASRSFVSLFVYINNAPEGKGGGV